MNVVIVSEFRAGFRPALEECYARAFESLGHQVHRIATYPELRVRRGVTGRVWGRWEAQRLARDFAHQVEAVRPDLILIVKGAGILARTAVAWRSLGARIVNVFPDNPFDAMAISGAGATLLRQLRACNRVFVHDRFAVGQLRRVGVPSDFIAFARDPELHDRALLRPGEPGPNIAFVGNPDPERIRYLRAIADLGLALWGAWEWACLRPDDPLARCVRGGVQLGPEMVQCLGTARLSVNILRPSQKTAHNMRTFESPACGVCTLSEASNGVLELMEDGAEVVTFRTPEELRAKVQELLDDDARRVRIAEAGWQRVEGETYAKRARQILDRLD